MTPPQQQVRFSRSLAARELHKLITDLALRANTWEEAGEAYDQLEEFMKTKARQHPEILLEPSINNCSHFIDALHLPFVHDKDCEFELRVAKSHAIFEELRQFCHEEAARNAQLPENEQSPLTWDAYAKLMLEPNLSNFSPLGESIYSGSEEVMEMTLSEIQHLHQRKHITDEQYASQFTMTTEGGYTAMLAAIESCNPEIFNRVKTELYILRRKGDISEDDYLCQFTCHDEKESSPMIHAIKTGDIGTYNSLSRKLVSLCKEGRMEPAMLVEQYTRPQSHGFTPLMEAAFSGDNELFCAVADDLKNALHMANHDMHRAQEQFREQLMAHSTDNFNLFHCATWHNPREHAESPNPFLLISLIDRFYESYDKEDARTHIRELYQDTIRTERYRTPFHSGQPQWLKDILSLSDVRPVSPSDHIQHG